MKLSFPIITCLLVILTSCTITNTPTKSTTPTKASETTQERNSDTSPNTSQMFTATEVAQHGTKESCWLILDNGVYDVTSYISRHPGGEKILRGCGKDATQMFAKHPESAKAMKEQFKIGTLSQ